MAVITITNENFGDEVLAARSAGRSGFLGRVVRTQ